MTDPSPTELTRPTLAQHRLAIEAVNQALAATKAAIDQSETLFFQVAQSDQPSSYCEDAMLDIRDALAVLLQARERLTNG